MIESAVKVIKESDNSVVMAFTIPIPPVTKKNHSQIIHKGERCRCCGKGKFPMLIPSKQYKQYEADLALFLMAKRPRSPIDFPVNLKCLFYQKTKAKSDLVGFLQAVQDIFVTYGLLLDDNHCIVATTDGSGVFYDKDNPRTEIFITRKDAI